MTVTDTLPAGSSPTAADTNANLNGWNVSFVGQTITATRSDALDERQQLPRPDADGQRGQQCATNVTNTATVAGGGETNTTNDTATDSTTITGVPDLTITKTHTGQLHPGRCRRHLHHHGQQRGRRVATNGSR